MVNGHLVATFEMFDKYSTSASALVIDLYLSLNSNIIVKKSSGDISLNAFI